MTMESYLSGRVNCRLGYARESSFTILYITTCLGVCVGPHRSLLGKRERQTLPKSSQLLGQLSLIQHGSATLSITLPTNSMVQYRSVEVD